MAAFVKDFQYDIFLSYAHANDLPEIEGDKGWVAKFHNNLAHKLTQLIGRRENFEIFCDPKIRGLDHDVKIEAALRSSALMVMVLSPAWLASTYCVQELDIFWDACTKGTGPLVGECCRVVKVGYDHVPGENHPEKVRKFSGFPFFEYDKDTAELTHFHRTREEDPDQRYWQLLDRLARHLHRMLLKMAPQLKKPVVVSKAFAVSAIEGRHGESRMNYQVFISAKMLATDGKLAIESHLAREIFDFLCARGLRVFLSTVTLESLGTHAYKATIDAALDAASVLIAVGASPESLNSEWVKYEWDSFFNDIISGIKPQGRVFTYTSGLAVRILPRALRQTQVFAHDPPSSLERLHNFIAASLSGDDLDRGDEPSSNRVTLR